MAEPKAGLDKAIEAPKVGEAAAVTEEMETEGMVALSSFSPQHPTASVHLAPAGSADEACEHCSDVFSATTSTHPLGMRCLPSR